MCREFTITVSPVPNQKIVSKEPEFMLNLSNQRVKVGESLDYSPGASRNTYGYLMDVELFLGEAFRFAHYDKVFNSFKVNGDLV